jgi:4'-phosphopantetheinyl transferase
LGLEAAPLSRVDLRTSRDTACLSEDERARAQRFRYERDRRRYLNGRAWMRTVLAAAVDVSPSGLTFSYGPHGRPDLPELPVIFNFTNTAEVGVLAYATGAAAAAITALGVDAEDRADAVSSVPVARQFFSPHEVDALFRLPPDHFHEAFLRCWTRKEALLKALGAGLSLPLHDFAVSLTPGRPVVEVAGPVLGDDPWQLTDISDDVVVAAVAARTDAHTHVIRITTDQGES